MWVIGTIVVVFIGVAIGVWVYFWYKRRQARVHAYSLLHNLEDI